MTKTDKNWEKLFVKYNIIKNINKNGHIIISSKEINEFREARLMTKFDHRKNLPKLFKDYNLSILPITRGNYIISEFDAYKTLDYKKDLKPNEISFPYHIESIDLNNIYSEAIALNCAYSTGIIKDFLEEDFLPTVSGRMSSDKFDYYIRNTKNNKNKLVNVLNSQVEIDGGYESKNKLMIVEAKNVISDDFLVRQLYYPYRLWNDKIKKDVVPVFMTYSNDIFSFFEFKFENPLEYNSLKLIKQKNYILSPEKISLNDVMYLLNNIKIIKEPQIPYPQADSFERVINLLEMLMKDELEKDYLTHTLDVDPRQTNYYTSALLYLGLIDKKKENGDVIYYINNEGKRIMDSQFKKKYLNIVEKILINPSFNLVLKLYFKKSTMPSTDEIVDIMKKTNVYNVNSESTFRRRARTVKAWINWIINLTKSTSI